jgi:hypothetical protein
MILGLILCALLAVPVFAAPTTQITAMAIAPNGTVVAERTVDYRWMEANLPVLGDGVTHYYQQGPVFTDDKEARWDPNETTNFKDRGAVKCTDLADLAGLVGGVAPGDDVMVHAVDGFHVEFGYPNVATPDPRQGPVGICWFNAGETDLGERQGVGYPPDYHVGMRLVFFADTSTNPEGKHVFGNTDMRAVMPPEAVHLFDDLYPSTSGYGVKWIDEIRVYQGGYTGARNAVIKSLVDPVPATTLAQTIPLPMVLTLASLAGAAILARRR